MSTDVLPPARPIVTAKLSPFEDSTSLLSDPQALRARGQADGYLFFKGLVDPDRVHQLRQDVLTVLKRFGLTRDGEPLNGRLDLEAVNAMPVESLRLDIGVTREIYAAIQQLPSVHAFSHDPKLLKLYQLLLDDEVFVHPRRVVRAFTPHPANRPTPPHQDYPLFQGNKMTWTCWLPIGDCPVERGPLAVLRGSHRQGYIPMRFGADSTTNWSDWGAQLCDYENDWVGGGLEAGDVLTFTCFTVHSATPNTTADQVRLSLDVRYQRASDPIDQESLKPHGRDLTWDQVYSGWGPEHSELMYYWEPKGMSLSDHDDSLEQQGERRIC